MAAEKTTGPGRLRSRGTEEVTGVSMGVDRIGFESGWLYKAEG